MRVCDKIANEIMEKLIDRGYKFKKTDFLDIECLIADTITGELKTWLNYDVDQRLHQERF